jgi:hypothetical protein
MMSSYSKVSTTTVVLLALLVSTEGFSLTPPTSSISCRTSSSSAVARQRQSPLYYSIADDEDDDDEDDEDDDDDDEVMDADSLGDWRTFRRNLASQTLSTTGAASQLEEFGGVVPKTKSVSKANEELLQKQNEKLAKEYMSGVWAHETSTVRTMYKEGCAFLDLLFVLGGMLNLMFVPSPHKISCIFFL